MPGTFALTEATYYILLSLHKPRHGYGIMQQTEEMSGGRVRLAAGTLYGALNTLCDKGWIVLKTVDEDSRRKEYQLTDKGREILINEVKRLKELTRNGEMILGEQLKYGKKNNH
jgi:DNA-binding PadR family transcriptional regulator